MSYVASVSTEILEIGRLSASFGAIYSNSISNIFVKKATFDANALSTLSIYTRQTQQNAQSFRPCVSGEFDI